MWRTSVLTIFPEMFPGPLGLSLAGKALAANAWSLDVVDIRSFASDKHRTVDDTPAGEGNKARRARPRHRRRGDGRAPAASDVAARHAADAGTHRGAEPRRRGR